MTYAALSEHMDKKERNALDQSLLAGAPARRAGSRSYVGPQRGAEAMPLIAMFNMPIAPGA